MRHLMHAYYRSPTAGKAMISLSNSHLCDAYIQDSSLQAALARLRVCNDSVAAADRAKGSGRADVSSKAGHERHLVAHAPAGSPNPRISPSDMPDLLGECVLLQQLHLLLLHSLYVACCTYEPRTSCRQPTLTALYAAGATGTPCCRCWCSLGCSWRRRHCYQETPALLVEEAWQFALVDAR